eukprot:UN03014
MDEKHLTDDRAFTFPGITTCLDEIQKTNESIADRLGLPLGPVKDNIDPQLNKVLHTMPIKVDGSRFVTTGIQGDSSVQRIIEEYLEDELNIEVENNTNKLNIGFIGLGNMGYYNR